MDEGKPPNIPRFFPMLICLFFFFLPLFFFMNVTENECLGTQILDHVRKGRKMESVSYHRILDVSFFSNVFARVARMSLIYECIT